MASHFHSVAIARSDMAHIDRSTLKQYPRIVTISRPGTTPMTRSISADEDFFERRNLRITCTIKHMRTDFRPQASEILPNLYLSDMYTATNPTVLRRLGITHVISVVETMWHAFPSDIVHLCLSIHDSPFSDMSYLFDPTVDWMQDAMDGNEHARVLVHCMLGMSRSASVVLAYLMASRGMSLVVALAHVKVRRIIVQPNAGFVKQLMWYERLLRDRERWKSSLR
ncbi:hypothetical protein HWV62_19761 [Athelia sp. TMB]|nr:hypothetical protein HWV62_19761 [Athelia sp. TMB]